MKKQATTVEQIKFNKLWRDLLTLVEEVDRRLASEFDAFSPTMWKRLQRTVDSVILEISAVRLALNGYRTSEVALKLGLKKQQGATMDTKAHCDDYCTHTNQAEVTERAFNYVMAEAKKTGDTAFFLDILVDRIMDAIPAVQAEEADARTTGAKGMGLVVGKMFLVTNPEDAEFSRLIPMMYEYLGTEMKDGVTVHNFYDEGSATGFLLTTEETIQRVEPVTEKRLAQIDKAATEYNDNRTINGKEF